MCLALSGLRCVFVVDPQRHRSSVRSIEEGILTMHLRLRADDGLTTPRRGGWRPRMPSLVGAWPFAPLALVALVAACSNGSGDQVTPPVAVGMTSKINPTYDDGQLTLFEVDQAVPLPVRKPSDADEKALGAAPKGTPYPHMPFLTADDESVEVHFVLSNVDKAQHNVWLLINPWNEFVRWKPGVSIVSDEETIPNNGYDKQYVVPGMSRVQGTITSDDMHEIAIKLASVQNFLASSEAKATTMASGDDDDSGGPTPAGVCNNIFEYQNRSNSVPADPYYTPWIPPVIAGLTGFDLGLRMEADEDADDPTMTVACPPGAMSCAGNVAIEITMEIQDLNGDRFVPQDTTDAQIGTPPKTLSPPAARF
jgi:hypothetical protein